MLREVLLYQTEGKECGLPQKFNGNLKLVWNGNEIIASKDLVACPDLPSNIISGCIDENNEVVPR